MVLALAIVGLIGWLIVRRGLLGMAVAPDELALLGIIAAPMGTALGFVGGVLVNTRTVPDPGTPPPYPGGT